MDQLSEERVLNALRYGYFDSYFKEEVFGNEHGVLTHKNWRKNRNTALGLLEEAIDILLSDKLREMLSDKEKLDIMNPINKGFKVSKIGLNENSNNLRVQKYNKNHDIEWEKLVIKLGVDKKELLEMIRSSKWTEFVNTIATSFVIAIKEILLCDDKTIAYITLEAYTIISEESEASDMELLWCISKSIGISYAQ